MPRAARPRKAYRPRPVAPIVLRPPTPIDDEIRALAGWAQLPAATRARLDAMTGGITGLAADCNGRPAAGVVVERTAATQARFTSTRVVCNNTLAIAKRLEQHPQVAWVRYAGLESSDYKPLVDHYMGGRASGILSFGIKGGAEAGGRFIDALQLITRLVNIGDAKSLACQDRKSVV